MKIENIIVRNINDSDFQNETNQNKLESSKKNNNLGIINNLSYDNSGIALPHATNFESSVISIKKKLTNKQLDQVKNNLKQHFLFKDKSPNIIVSLFEKLELIKVNANIILYKEGDKGDFFYLIKSGSVEITTSKTNVKKIYKTGETFGELALLERKKRTESVKTLELCFLYELDGKIFRNIVNSINQNELKDRLKFIELVPILSPMDSIQLNSLASSMYACTFEIQQTIFNEGDVDDCLYIIKDGEVQCEKDNKVIRILKSRDFFGEYAILFNIPRSLTCSALTKVTCFKIANSLLVETLGKNYKMIILKSIMKEAFKNSLYLKIIQSSVYIDSLFNDIEIKLYNDGDVIINKNNKNDLKLFIIIGGNLISNEKKKNNEILGKRGQLFGEHFIKKGLNIEYDIIAQEECRIIEIKWDSIQSLVNFQKINKKKILSFFSNLEYMRGTNLFKNTSDNRLIKICLSMIKKKFIKGEFIFKEGEIGDKFYLLKKGKVKVLKNKKIIREMEEGSCFGELSLLINEPRSATVEAITECSVYILTKQVFNENIDKNMLEYFHKKIALEDNFKLTLNDLFFCKNLGKGKFGNVSLVHDQKNYYAIKAVSRNAAEKQKILIKYFLEEKRVLLKLDHPFVMKLVKTFKDESNVFYLTEFINGKSMAKYIDKRQENDIQNKLETQFYVSTLFIILNYLNSKNIIHRDLKPDNIMIDEKGYLKLIDFGTAIILKDFTSTITGTPHYIAPEVLLGKGYNSSCDYWSLGIITHELYYNSYPFGNNATNPMDIYKQVLKIEVNLSLKGDPIVNSFIRALLKKKTSKRLCSLDLAKKHSFFKDYNWEDLIDFKVKPPFIPKVVLLKKFEDYNQKYEEHMKIENMKNNDNNTLLSSYDDDNDYDNIKYPSNWVDEF